LKTGGRSQRGSSPWLLVAAAILVPEAALAAGGPHMIDDSEVETAGDCHLETWLTRSSRDQWHASAGAGCTLEAVPVLELGGFVGQMRSPGMDETMVGLTPKVNLRPAETGFGIALAGSLSYGLDRDRIETASLITAVTVPAGDSLRINLNGGWVWSEAGPGSELFAGAQAELAVGPRVSLMAEGFTRDHGNAGSQAGVRWTSGNGRIDLDLLAGRYLDGATPTSLTLGLTARW
jgi:hypothetical protein